MKGASTMNDRSSLVESLNRLAREPDESKIDDYLAFLKERLTGWRGATPQGMIGDPVECATDDYCPKDGDDCKSDSGCKVETCLAEFCYVRTCMTEFCYVRTCGQEMCKVRDT